MGYEDISGTRLFHSDYIGGTIAAASGNRLLGAAGFTVWKPFTITSVALGAGTTRPAGATCSIKVWVNGARKGLAVLALTHGAGAYVSESAAVAFTGPANAMINLSVNSVGSTAGVGARYQVRYHHGWSA